MNSFIKIGIVTFVIVLIFAIVLLKPIITSELEYKVVVVNTSEQTLSSVTILGAGENSGPIGPIEPGHKRHYIFTPQQAGQLEYSIVQHGKVVRGLIDEDLQAGESGEIFVILGELHKVKIQDFIDL